VTAYVDWETEMADRQKHDNVRGGGLQIVAGHEAREDVLVVPLQEEQLVVERRTVEAGRVRVATHVRERREAVDELLLRERGEVERVPVNKVVDAVPLPREEGDTFVISVVEEQLVVERRLVVTEEIHVRKTRATERHREEITLRSEEAEVVRSDGDPPMK
jgi:uncharacterized protein (TIGR02271 family)